MFELESKPESVCELEAFVRSIADKYHLDDNLYADILITLTEAVNNAILHGNKKDCQKKVNIHLKQNTDRLHIYVEDQGNGFDPKNIKNPTDPENIHNCGGRGVFLINQICHSVHYHRNGSVVQLCFRI
nr:ATP-binding protein [Saprospiraceae bacterium]